MLLIFNTCKCIFGWLGAPYTCLGELPGKDVVIKVLAGIAQFSKTVGSLSRTLWLAKPARKIWQKMSNVNLLLWKKITQLLLIKHIWQSQKFRQIFQPQLC